MDTKYLKCSNTFLAGCIYHAYNDTNEELKNFRSAVIDWIENKRFFFIARNCYGSQTKEQLGYYKPVIRVLVICALEKKLQVVIESVNAETT